MYDFDEYDDTGIQEQETVHDSSQTPFSEEGLARKRKALMHDFASGSQARDKAAVQREGKELSLEGVMELLNSQTSGQVSAGKVSAEASGQVSADASPDSDSEKQSSSEEEQPSSFCGPLESKTGASASATKPPANAKAKSAVSVKPQPAVSDLICFSLYSRFYKFCFSKNISSMLV